MGLCNAALVLYVLSPWKMAPRTAWSSGSVLIVAVFEIGNTKQWKTKRVLCVIYQEISTGIVTYPVVFFFSIFFLSEGKKMGKLYYYYFDFIFNLPFCLGNKPNNKRLYETADYVFSSSFLLHLRLKCSSFLFKFAYCIIIIQLLLDQRLKNKWSG